MIGPEYYALQQCDKVIVEDNTMPYMKSLYSCLNRIKGDGYTASFEKTINGIHAKDSNHNYLPEDYKVINFFRFEGNVNVGDNVVMYMIETKDGLKGTLVNSYNSSVNPELTD